MHIAYSDITSRIAEPPLWWLNGVPRYCPFRPQETDIYAREALLVHIRCQACGADFNIGLFDPRDFGATSFRERLLQSRTLGVGDPPNSGCCDGGCSMSADEVAVLEFWERRDRDWLRVPPLERDLTVSGAERLDRHREAWRRIRSYAARPADLLPRWASPTEPPEFPPRLPQPMVDRTPETGKFIDTPALNARRRRALLAFTGRIDRAEYETLGTLSQTEYASYEARPAGPRPGWAEALADEIRQIDETVLANAISGYAAMSAEERDERYCHGLDRRLEALARTGRMGQEERLQLFPLLIPNRYSR